MDYFYDTLNGAFVFFMNLENVNLHEPFLVIAETGTCLKI